MVTGSGQSVGVGQIDNFIDQSTCATTSGWRLLLTAMMVIIIINLARSECVVVVFTFSARFGRGQWLGAEDDDDDGTLYYWLVDISSSSGRQ